MFINKLLKFLGKPSRSSPIKEQSVHNTSSSDFNRNINSIDEIVGFLKRRGERLLPLTTSQIASIEENCRCELPGVYREFLSRMGNGSGNFMEGTSVFFDRIINLHCQNEELMKENGMPPLPANTFTFWMHQGYRSAYFFANAGDDPPVYFFSEEMSDFGCRLMTNSLTDFFVYQLSVSYPEENIDISHMPVARW